MDLQSTISSLGRLSNQSKREGYPGDETEYSFRKHVLILLEEFVDETKKLKKSIRTNNSELRRFTNVLRRLETSEKVEDAK